MQTQNLSQKKNQNQPQNQNQTQTHKHKPNMKTNLKQTNKKPTKLKKTPNLYCAQQCISISNNNTMASRCK